MEHRCPRCNVIFTGSKWKLTQQRHDNRKNPCDQSGPYIREPLKPVEYKFTHDFNSMEFGHMKPPMNYKTRTSIAPRILKQIIELDQNKCVSWINIKNDDIVIRQSGELKHVNLDELVDLCMLFLHYQVYPTLVDAWTKYEEFKEWMFQTTLVELNNDTWQSQDISKTCEYRNSIRLFLIDYFGHLKGKRRAHRLLLAEPPPVTA